MFNLLISVIIWLALLGLIWYLVKMLPMPAPFNRFVDIAFILIAILVLLGALTGNMPVPALFGGR